MRRLVRRLRREWFPSSHELLGEPNVHTRIASFGCAHHGHPRDVDHRTQGGSLVGGVPNQLRAAGRARRPAALLLTGRGARRTGEPTHHQDRRLAGQHAGRLGDGHQQLGGRPADLARVLAVEVPGPCRSQRDLRRDPRDGGAGSARTHVVRSPVDGAVAGARPRGWCAGLRRLRFQSRDVRRRTAGPADRRQLPTFGGPGPRPPDLVRR